MKNAWQTLKQKERSFHSVTEPGEQYMWCNHLMHIDGKVLNDGKWAKKGILKVKDVIDEDGELRYNNIKHKINNQAEIYLKLFKI